MVGRALWRCERIKLVSDFHPVPPFAPKSSLCASRLLHLDATTLSCLMECVQLGVQVLLGDGASLASSATSLIATTGVPSTTLVVVELLIQIGR